jgi:tetratricopeptide (TPR) repeat protein
MKEPGRRKLIQLLVGAALFLGTLAIYAPVRHYEFLNYDDDDYVSDNPHVMGGFTRDNVVYALAHFHSSNWHPLTWLSHMADAEIFGKNAGGHHVTNVVLHSLNAVLLLLVLAGMTGAFWRSAFVAAIFAWHPLHVESVAWISERKDILCALFWILTMGAYASYVRKPLALRYLLVVLLFLLGLMSKAMMITLPFVLLLLDYWPLQRASLRRTDGPKWFNLFLEKIPLFVLAALAGAVTVSTQARTGALKSALEFPWQLRLANIPISYLKYVLAALWPVKLAVLYPLPSVLSTWQAAASAVLLILITVIAIRERIRKPYFFVGWLLFIGSLLPVIGLVQVGSQAMADRYMYIPLIGLSVAFVWMGWQLIEMSGRPVLLGATVFGLTSVLMVQATVRQLSYWQNSATLFQRAVSVTTDNGIARGNLSAAFLSQFKPDAAAAEAREAIRIMPNHPVGYMSLGMAMLMKKRISEAILNLEKALQLQPDWPDVHQDLGGALILTGRVDDAIPHFYETLRLSPDHVPALKALAWIRATQSDSKLRDANEALRLAERAVQLTNNKDAQALDVLGAAQAEAGQLKDATNTAEHAKALALAGGKAKLADEISERIELYRLGFPFRTRR